MNQDLVGYFLGALDPDAKEDLERQLHANPALQEELGRIGGALRPLRADGDVDPPPGLAARTVRRVMWLRQPEPCAPPAPTAWRFMDLATAAGILLVISLIILPALHESRQQRQLVECSNHLRALGVALEGYSERFAQYLPFHGTSGPFAVAGVYAPLLLESQWVSDRSVFVCPASGDDVSAIRSLGELRLLVADVDRYDSMLRGMGGSYGALLGHREEGVYRAPRMDRLAWSSVLVDQPGRAADGCVVNANSPNHGGRGQNALCRDGSVRFYEHPRECSTCDDFFVSVRNRVEPGWNPADSVFGPSEARVGAEPSPF